MNRFFLNKNFIIASIFINFIFALLIVRRIYYQKKDRPIPHTAYFFERDGLYKILPIEKNDIVFIGDSETFYFPLQELFNRTNIKNRGINGDNLKGVYNRLEDILKWHPKSIYLQIGANDINNTSIDTVKFYMNLIVKKIKNECGDSCLHVESILPQDISSYPRIELFNKIYKSICQNNRVNFIDIFPFFAINDRLNPKYDVGDNLHLNAKGYIQWVSVLKPYIN